MWLEHEGFKEQLINGWHSFTIQGNLAEEWKNQMQFLRRKLRGWSIN